MNLLDNFSFDWKYIYICVSRPFRERGRGTVTNMASFQVNVCVKTVLKLRPFQKKTFAEEKEALKVPVHLH